MIAFEPVQYVMAKLFGECQEFSGILFCGDAGHIVFNRVAFDAAGVEICSVSLAFVAKDHRQCCQCAEVLKMQGPQRRAVSDGAG